MIKRLACLILVGSFLMAIGPWVSADDNVTIVRVAHWMGDYTFSDVKGTVNTEELVREMIRPYGIDIEVVINSPTNYREKVIAQAVAGVGPDVIFESSLWLGMFHGAGILMDLTPFLEADEEIGFDSYIPQTWNFMHFDNGTWLLPTGGGPYLMFYNRQHFLQAGVEFPDGRWDWFRDMGDLIRKMRETDSSGNVTRYGLLLENRLMTPVLSNQGEILDFDHTQSLLDQQEVIEITELFQNWRLQNLIPRPANHRPTFANELGAIHGVMGTFGIETYQGNPSLDYGITYVPTANGARALEGHIGGWGVSAQTKHPEEAWIVAKAFVMANAQGPTNMSWIRGKVDSERLANMQQEWSLSMAEIEVILDSLQYMRPPFQGGSPVRSADILQIAERALMDVVWEGKPARSTLENAANSISALLE